MVDDLEKRLHGFKGGCIKFKSDEWRKLTSDSEILDTVCGMSINLIGELPDLAARFQYPFGAEEHDFVSKEVQRLLRLQVICQSQHEEGEFISPIFIRPKPDGDFRLILNLKKLNEQSEKIHFKMDTLSSILTLIYPGVYMCKIDIKDAYYSVPIRDDDQKLLKFIFDEVLYQFCVLPNGYTKGPRKFTKLLKPVLATLRKMGITLAAYLDDIIMIAQSFYKCFQAMLALIQFLQTLGFVIHAKKSVLIPTRCLEFLGFIINSSAMTVALTSDKKQKIYNRCCNVVESIDPLTIRDVAKLLGKFSSSFIGVNEGKLHFRYLEKCKSLSLAKPSIRGNFDKPIILSMEAIEEIIWWKENILSSYSPITRDNPDITFSSDASKIGWGASSDYFDTGGLYTEEEREEHINILESKAVLFSLKSLFDGLSNKHIQVLCDNTATVGAVNNMGSSKSMKLHGVIVEIWEWILASNNWLSASHIPGVLNVKADKESRTNITRTEWMITSETFDFVMGSLGVNPTIDLFASRINNKLPRFASYRPDPDAEFINAFSFSWSDMCFYAFPPFICIGRVLQKIIKDRATGVLIVPDWPNQPWYNRYMELIVDEIILLPREKLLVLPTDSNTKHPLHRTLTLRAGLVDPRLLTEIGSYRKTHQ